MSVSAHRSEASIRSYSKTGHELKRKMSETLSKSMALTASSSKVQKVSTKSSTTLVYPTNFNFGAHLHKTLSSPEKENLPIIPVLQNCTGNVVFNSCTFNITQK